MIDGAWELDANSGGYGERGFFSYGVNLIGGFDFYIAKHLYLGYELTFGLSKVKYKDIDVKTRNGIITSPASSTDTNQTDFTLGANLLNGIRLGYAF